MYIGESQTLISFIKIEGRTLKGLFQERRNRFLALVKVEDMILPSFLPNPGRMYELLTPGKEVLLREVFKEKRRTSYDLIGVFHRGQTVSVDSRLPNRLVLEALKNRDIEELSEYNIIKPEYAYRYSRFDFLLTNGHEPCILEVKSCTLVKDRVALFPDAKTERGRRHLRDLIESKKEGYRACVLFIVQRTDALFLAPNDETDPQFGKILRDAASKGVEVYAYYSNFIKNKITLKGKVGVKLEPHQDN
ncbi:MAG: DNA/RNA nuclease SfsA [Candidatus Methylarchaceae archaeon HK02M1]|nr:DNA/RNA nuclease SfsA [Candidatus Methylarchaceae archaeon HK02M1]